MIKLKKYEKYIVLISGFLLHLTIGSLYTYNNTSNNLIEYMKNKSLSKDSVNQANAVWIFSLSVFGLGSSVSFGGIMSTKIGPSLTVLLGGWFMSLNVVLMSWMINTYISVVIIFYGLCTGIGAGVVYGVTLGTVCLWFPKRRGLVCGITVCGFGLSAALFDIIQLYFQKLDNSDQRVPESYLIIGSIYFAVQFISSLFLHNPNQNNPFPKNENIENDGSQLTHLASYPIYNSFDKNIKSHHIYWELDYWIMWITFALLSACFTLIVSMTQDFGSDIMQLFDNKVLFIVSFCGSVCSALGRIVWGILIDKFNYKIVLWMLSIPLAIFFIVFYVSVLLPVYKKSDIALNIFYCITVLFLYAISCGIFSIYPCMCFKLFGDKYFISNYGLLFTAYSFGGLITGTIYTLSYHNYLAICISGSVMSLLAASTTIAFRGKSLVQQKNDFF